MKVSPVGFRASLLLAVACVFALASPAAAVMEFYESFDYTDGVSLDTQQAPTGQTWYDNGAANQLTVDNWWGSPNISYGVSHYPNGQNGGNSVDLADPIDGASENFVLSWDVVKEFSGTTDTARWGIGFSDSTNSTLLDMGRWSSPASQQNPPFVIGGLFGGAVVPVPATDFTRFELTIDRVNKTGSMIVTDLTNYVSNTTDLGSWTNPGATFNPNVLSIGVQGVNHIQSFDNLRIETFTPTRPVSVSVDSFGTEADGAAALQAAINTNAETVIIPNNGSDWLIDKQVNLLHSNQTIQFADGAVLQAKTGAFAGDGEVMLYLSNQGNVNIQGNGTIRMNKAEYHANDPTGEARHGLRIDDSWSVLVDGLTIEDTGGDGIYISGMSGTANAGQVNIGAGQPPEGFIDQSYSKDVTIRNVTIDNAHRNGISIIAGVDVTIEDSVIINTKDNVPGAGGLPGAGIDFEPNVEDQRLSNIVVKNTVIANNEGPGLFFIVDDTQIPGIPVTITAENLTIDDSNTNNVRFHLDSIPGIDITDSLIINSAAGTGIFVANAFDPAVVVEYTAFSGNASGPVNPVAGTPGDPGVFLGTGTLSGTAPVFINTSDPTHPFYYYLDPSTSALITGGASDGSYMGARPVANFDADFDGSGLVDGNDFLLWQRGFGSMGQVDNSMGDADGNTIVDDADLAVWQGQYGGPPPLLSAASAAVPEPTGLALLLIGSLTLGVGRRSGL